MSSNQERTGHGAGWLRGTEAMEYCAVTIALNPA
jgi:hypothetical protein